MDTVKNIKWVEETCERKQAKFQNHNPIGLSRSRMEKVESSSGDQCRRISSPVTLVDDIYDGP